MCMKGDDRLFRANYTAFFASASDSLMSPLLLLRQAFEGQLAWDSNPLYVLMHESIYCQGGVASDWAAHRVRADPEFNSAFDADKATKEGEDYGLF